MKSYFIKTYGCQMNVHESEKIAGQLESLGCVETKTLTSADIIVFNTCSIRENAVSKAFGNIGALKKLKRQNKNLLIAVGGCMTQIKKDGELLKETFPFIDIIFGTHNLHTLKDMISVSLASHKKIFDVWDTDGEIVEREEVLRTSFPNAWVNIMYGCNNFCSYCIVPYVRGRERSRKLEDITKEVESLLQNGYKEITLLGQNVDSYGNDLRDGTNFAKLLDVVANLPFEFRLRFMTSHPKDFKKDVVEVMQKNKNICSYVHLPVQSGSNKVLKEMNRKYSREDYLAQIDMIKSSLTGVGITSDIMVGFPGETEEDFLETLDLVKKVRFDSAFTFVYSIRKGTAAEKMDNHVDESVKSQRIQRLIALQNEISKEISNSYVGKSVSVLCDDFAKGVYSGRTSSNKLVTFNSNEKDLIGKILIIKINDATISALKGEIEREGN